MKTKTRRGQIPKMLPCIVCGHKITDKKKLDTPGAVHLGLALCSYRCAQQLIDFFKHEFRSLSRRKKALTQPLRENQPLAVQIRTTYNLACEVVGADTASLMADDAGL